MTDDHSSEPPVIVEDEQRRRFIQRVGLLTGAALLVRGAPVRSSPDAPSAAYVPRALLLDEFSAVTALMSRLIPADGGAAGAAEAGAQVYLDRALGSHYASELPMYRTALAALQLVARQMGNASIDRSPGPQLDTLIAQLEAGTLDTNNSTDPRMASALPDGGRAFFLRLRQHTIEGLFCDPMYGGNQAFLGWQLIGFPGVHFFYTAEEQSINGQSQSTNRSVADYGGAP